jgi:hypothetical protein
MRRKVEAMFEMPKRSEVDGPVSVNRPTEDAIALSASHKGEMQTIVVSRYNAARLLVMLCMMLEVPHPKPLGKLSM